MEGGEEGEARRLVLLPALQCACTLYCACTLGVLGQHLEKRLVRDTAEGI